MLKMMPGAAAALLLTVSGFAAEPLFVSERIDRLKGERVAGAEAQDENTVFAWGSAGIRRWIVRSGDSKRIAKGVFRAGCLMDIDGDGNPDVVVNEGAADSGPGQLVWFRAPDWSRHVIESGVDTLDVKPVTLYGRKGLLLIQGRNQVRFYEVPPDVTQRWSETRLYSLTTPADEGGLLVTDVDGDGIPDILAGNYWLKGPKQLNLPWQLYAIDTWTEQRPSALLHLGYIDLWGSGVQNRIAMQRAIEKARFAWFEKPADVKQLWTAHAIEEAGDLNRPSSLAIYDFDKDGRADLLVTERGGKGRMIIFYGADHFFRPAVQAETSGIVQAFVLNGEIITVQEDGLYRWRKPDPKFLPVHPPSRGN